MFSIPLIILLKHDPPTSISSHYLSFSCSPLPPLLPHASVQPWPQTRPCGPPPRHPFSARPPPPQILILRSEAAVMAESGRSEQIITQFYLKALHAILGSRIPHLHLHGAAPPDPARARKRDRWFNLALGDLPPALEHPHHSVMDPLIIDIILTPRAPADLPEAVLERWIAQCESWNPHHSSESSASFLYRTYKKLILLLRSLYSFLRLLPAYWVFRMFCSSNQSYNYDLSYRVSITLISSISLPAIIISHDDEFRRVSNTLFQCFI